MSRCQVCNHDQRWRIELLRAGGASLEALAQKFGIHRNAIHRHWLRHVTPEAKASFLMGPADFATLAEKAAKEGDCVLDYLKVCRGALLAQLAGMQAAGDARGVAYVVGQLTRTLEVYARITGEVSTLATSISITNNSNVAIAQHPDFARVQATLLRALAPHPQARADVVAALRDLDSEGAQAATTRPLVPIVDVTPRIPAHLEAAHG
jgi:hypothetical protein